MVAKLKKIWWLMLVFGLCNFLILLLLYTEKTAQQRQEVRPIPPKNMYSIAIIQSDSLKEQNKMAAGVKAALLAQGFEEGKNLQIQASDAAGDEKRLTDSIRQAIRSKKDLIIAIGTDATKEAVALTRTIPVVGVGAFHMRSDPAFENVPNLTGISDVPAILNQVRMAGKFLDLSTLGFFYDPTNEGAVLQLKILRGVAERKHIRLYEVAFDPSADVDDQLAKFIGSVKAVYIPEDERVIGVFPRMVDVFTRAGIPIIGEQIEMTRQGALLSISAGYYRMGFSGGRIASRLLSGNVTPSEIAIVKQQDPEIVLNMRQVKALHVKVPSDVWQRARKLYLYDGMPARP
ncbi:MAG: ABC transporter substrate-binding protein [Dialister sp.]|nr:ABC transporter substrate-binding protein [Dialister sp.]